MHQINPLNLEQKIGSKYMINKEEHTMLIAKSNSTKTTMLKSRLCDCSDAYILVKGKITITGAGDNAAGR